MSKITENEIELFAIELFEKGRSTISGHLKNIFEEKELDERVVCRGFRHTTAHGAIKDKTQEKSVKYYNLKAIIAVAKNYLNEEHIEQLKRMVSAYLDLAEDRALRGIVINMKDWVEFLDKFLALADYTILLNKRKISALEVKLKAYAEHEEYRVIQDMKYISDFDKLFLDIENSDRKVS